MHVRAPYCFASLWAGQPKMSRVDFQERTFLPNCWVMKSSTTLALALSNVKHKLHDCSQQIKMSGFGSKRYVRFFN